MIYFEIVTVHGCIDGCLRGWIDGVTLNVWIRSMNQQKEIYKNILNESMKLT